MVVGDGPLRARASLEAKQGLDLVDPPSEASPRQRSEIEEIAAALRAFQDVIVGVDRVLVVGASNPALAAVVVASKLRVPTAAIEGRAAEGGGRITPRLIGQLADDALADDPAAIAAWLAESRQPSRNRDGQH
jgi:hypothetical protein